MAEPPRPTPAAVPPPRTGNAATRIAVDGPSALDGRTPPQPFFHHDFAAEPAAIQATLVALRPRFATPDIADALARTELVLAEVLNNIAQHGTGRGKRDGAAPRVVQVKLTVVRHPGGLACAVSDDGPPLPPGVLAPGRTPALPMQAALSGGGFGWNIIRALARSLFHYRENDRNILYFNVPLSSDGG